MPACYPGEMSAPPRFGPDWVEDTALPDGTRVRLRCLRASDKDKLASGLQQLSPESRYHRFFTDKPRLTAAELRYLTEVDGHDHFALACARLDERGDEAEGLGVARFVRLPDAPHQAEAAVAVVDAMHGRGLGRLLMTRLIEAALERDVDVFRSELLALNKPMRELLGVLAPEVHFTTQGSTVIAELPLPGAPDRTVVEESDRFTALRRVLRLVAEQAAEVRRKWFRAPPE
jgi:GNAT superfamily N-acetyltransferase